MIGLLVIGHGAFATGLRSSMRLIAGEPENIEFVDFLEDHSVEELEQNLRQALSRLQVCHEVLILCDLVGGSPFKVAATISANTTTIDVIGGTNLPMLVEVYLSRKFLSFPEIKKLAIESGKNAIQLFTFREPEPSDVDEEGI